MSAVLALIALTSGVAVAGSDAACATPAVIDALAGRRPAPFEHALRPPPALDAQVRPGPPGGGKDVYGTPYDDHLNTDNFTINWWDSRVTTATAEAAGEALETAWAAFAEEQGWTQPASSDRYLLWILLDRSLGGTTGYTTEYTSDDYPEGYPVIYLNPDYAGDAAFWDSLAAHELMHAFQYALRDYSGGGEVETWYWEASATWGSELADPDVDGHQYTSDWYAATADRTYSSTENYRQYGLFVYNAWLDVEGPGSGTMKAVWDLSATRPGDAWDAIMTEAVGEDVTELWSGFAGAYVNRQLEESASYSAIAPEGVLSEGVSGSLPYLGSHAWRVGEDATVTAEGDVLLGSAWQVGDEVQVRAGEQLAVTGIGPGSSAYSLHLDAPGSLDTGGDGGATDGGATDGGATDGAGTDGGATDGGATDGGGTDGGGDGGLTDGGGSDAGRPDGGGVDDDDTKAGCGCGGGLAMGGLWLLPAVFVVRRRR